MIDALLKTPNGAGPAWAKGMREAALAQARALGFPTVKHEEWRFTNMAPLLQLPLHTAKDPVRAVSHADVKPFTFGLEGPRLVFVDGYFSAAFSTKGKITHARVGNLLGEKSPELEQYYGRATEPPPEFFAALNAAFFHDGAYVSVPAGNVIEQAIHFLFIATGTG